MRIIGNLLWWFFGGFESAIGYFTGSLALACTIIGIPFALQTIKIGLLCLWPFGSTVRETNSPTGLHSHSVEFTLADFRRSVGLPHTSVLRVPFIYHDYRNSLEKTTFQDGWTFARTIRQSSGTDILKK